MAPSSFGFEVVRQVTYYGQRQTTVSPQSITVIQRESNHEVVSLVSYRDDNAPNRYDSGTPVSLSWGLAGQRVEVFQGYVNHSEPVVVATGSDERRNLVKVVCVGATSPMKERHQRVWKGRTIPSVMAQVFRSYKLSAQIDRHDRVWDSLVQEGETDWEFVCSLAQRIGWTVRPRNTDIRVSSRRMKLRQQRSTIPVFQASTPAEPTGGLRQILSFQAIDGETTPDGGQKANRLVQGLDPWQGEIFTAEQENVQPQLGWISPAPAYNEFATDISRSYGEAADRLMGQAEGARLYLQARVEAVGDATVHPGTLVCLLGVGAKNNGLWYVGAVEHELTGGNYYVHLDLGRDARWDTGYRPLPQRRRAIQHRAGAYGEIAAVAPPTVLVAGAWRAAYNVPVNT